MKRVVEVIQPNSFEPENHFYPKALNAQLDSMVSHFFAMGHERLIKRYSHLKPDVDVAVLKDLLNYQCKYLLWGGSDLFYVATEQGNRKIVVLETNSCPSGQKSLPASHDTDEYRGYKQIIENSFLAMLKKKKGLPKGHLAVIYDKNYMEATGYACTIAELTGEAVYLIPHFNKQKKHIHFDKGVMVLTLESGEQVTIKAAYRYVTQKPWNRLPVNCKTWIYNSTLACLAGGRNKLLANKAYEIFNSELAGSGLKIDIPETIKDVNKLEIPIWVQRFGGKAVIKNPYSNAGQGVYTITTEEELDSFMKDDHDYDQFIVQSLIGHYDWSSQGDYGKYFHIGTIPNSRGNIFIADLRVMVYSSLEGFKPCSIYARRARKPLGPVIETHSWDVLGTNLSVKVAEDQWDSDSSRLMIMDRKDFNALGIGIDDLIEAYIQTVLSVIAIDKMAKQLVTQKGVFRFKLFKSLDNDPSLHDEMML